MRGVALLLACGILAVGSLVSSCFERPTPECAFLCGADQSCPDGYFCATDGACKRDGLADDFDCGFSAPDDAGPPGGDASTDAPEAPDDAGLDAGIDAS